MGCVSTLPGLDPSFSLCPNLALETSRRFQDVLKAEPGTAGYERARIEYLLERVSKSPYNFIRNNSRYSGKRGAIHIKWKYYFRSGRQVKTAEEFIDKVATASKKSGRPYLIELPDKRRFPLRSLLLNELKRLDQELEKRRKEAEEKAAEAASGANP